MFDSPLRHAFAGHRLVGPLLEVHDHFLAQILPTKILRIAAGHRGRLYIFPRSSPFDCPLYNYLPADTFACFEDGSASGGVPVLGQGNLPFNSSGGDFGDQAVAAAMVDRMVHHADVLTLECASYRRSGARPSLPDPLLVHARHAWLFRPSTNRGGFMRLGRLVRLIFTSAG